MFKKEKSASPNLSSQVQLEKPFRSLHFRPCLRTSVCLHKNIKDIGHQGSLCIVCTVCMCVSQKATCTSPPDTNLGQH